MDSVTFSCVTAAPVRTPHLPCLSLFLVYRNHFNELNSLANSGTRMPRFSRLRLQRYYKKPIPTKYFSNFFSRIFRKFLLSPISQHLTSEKIYVVKHIFLDCHTTSSKNAALSSFNASRTCPTVPTVPASTMKPQSTLSFSASKLSYLLP